MIVRLNYNLLYIVSLLASFSNIQNLRLLKSIKSSLFSVFVTKKYRAFSTLVKPIVFKCLKTHSESMYSAELKIGKFNLQIKAV